MKIKSREILPNVLVLIFDTRYELTMSFVRLQEFYESPKFQGKVFSLEEYMDYWAKEFGKGVFDYTTRWRGFNVPGKVVLDWMDKFNYDDKSSIRAREIALIEKILSRYSKKDLENSYIIATHYDCPNKKEVIDHEVAHAMYTLNPEYKAECQKLFSKINSTKEGRLVYERMEDKLIKMGYASNLLEDEIQAYWATGDEYTHLCKEYTEVKELRKVYKQFRKERT